MAAFRLRARQSSSSIPDRASVVLDESCDRRVMPITTGFFLLRAATPVTPSRSRAWATALRTPRPPSPKVEPLTVPPPHQESLIRDRYETTSSLAAPKKRTDWVARPKVSSTDDVAETIDRGCHTTFRGSQGPLQQVWAWHPRPRALVSSRYAPRRGFAAHNDISGTTLIVSEAGQSAPVIVPLARCGPTAAARGSRRHSSAAR
jgi:hypothetical protein